MEQLFEQYGEELRRFIYGVLRDRSLTNDVVQSAFVKLVQGGQAARAETRKAWLFKVAFHEALLVRRKAAIAARAGEWLRRAQGEHHEDTDWLMRREEIQRVRDAVAGLPADQQIVVRKRIYEELTFAQIAAALRIPLGTALARMHTALRKLRERLDKHE